MKMMMEGTKTRTMVNEMNIRKKNQMDAMQLNNNVGEKELLHSMRLHVNDYVSNWVLRSVKMEGGGWSGDHSVFFLNVQICVSNYLCVLCEPHIRHTRHHYQLHLTAVIVTWNRSQQFKFTHTVAIIIFRGCYTTRKAHKLFQRKCNRQALQK